MLTAIYKLKLFHYVLTHTQPVYFHVFSLLVSFINYILPFFGIFGLGCMNCTMGGRVYPERIFTGRICPPDIILYLCKNARLTNLTSKSYFSVRGPGPPYTSHETPILHLHVCTPLRLICILFLTAYTPKKILLNSSYLNAYSPYILYYVALLANLTQKLLFCFSQVHGPPHSYIAHINLKCIVSI